MFPSARDRREQTEGAGRERAKKVRPDGESVCTKEVLMDRTSGEDARL
jgi:hypothetical protein